MRSVFYCVLFIPLIHSTADYSQALQTVDSVSLQRYIGKWYEIASFPQRFQKGCTCTMAEYNVNQEGNIKVINSCNLDSVSGKLKTASAIAFVKKNSGNAKLKVRFFWPVSGKYWIIDLADDYSYSVVSHPNKKYLWILSRTPEMRPEIIEAIKTRLQLKGFDLSKLRNTLSCRVTTH